MASQNIIAFQEKVDKNSSTQFMGVKSAKKAQREKQVKSENNVLQSLFDKNNNQMMAVEEACDPEFILWQNIGFTE